MNKSYAPWLGLIPIIPLVPATLQLDLNNLNWSFAMFVIEVIAVVCCILLLIKRRKT
jgi:hypothetical protein